LRHAVHFLTPLCKETGHFTICRTASSARHPRKRQIALTLWRLKMHSASGAVVPSLALCDGGPVHDRVEFPLAIAVEPMPDDPG
jgi:hypothetical protein